MTRTVSAETAKIIEAIAGFSLATALWLSVLVYLGKWTPTTSVFQDGFSRVFFFGLGVMAMKKARQRNGIVEPLGDSAQVRS